MRSITTLLAALAGLVLAATVVRAEEAPALPLKTQTCQLCHAVHAGHQVRSYHGDCLDCHTPDPIHVTHPGKNVKFPDADKCLACHRHNDERRMNWAFAEHRKAGIDCRDCHGMHAPKVKEVNVGSWKTDENSVRCLQCHQDVAVRFNMPSHHPVKEGALACTGCHDPHGSNQAALIERNDRCFTCHQAIRGPKVFEHAPVVEDCGICHNPHGSPNRRLLQVSQPVLCLQCHSQAVNRHPESGAILRQCTNCHGAIHGSHADARLKH